MPRKPKEKKHRGVFERDKGIGIDSMTPLMEVPA
jgi:hypothetical protein